MELVNLTRHPINLYDISDCTFKTARKSLFVRDEAQPLLTIPSSGFAKCTVKTAKIENIEGYDVYTSSYCELEGIPEPQEGTCYIVSLIAANAGMLSGRKDCITPFHIVRNDEGSIIGCTAFSSVGQ